MLTTICGNGGCSKSITREKFLNPSKTPAAVTIPSPKPAASSARHRPGPRQSNPSSTRTAKNTSTSPAISSAATTLQMKIVDVEYILGGELILYYFTSEQRIDFRSLVRDLAHDLHTRIELRQVGARDEARITADYEKCGQHCCCCRAIPQSPHPHLHAAPPKSRKPPSTPPKSPAAAATHVLPALRGRNLRRTPQKTAQAAALTSKPKPATFGSSTARSSRNSSSASSTTASAKAVFMEKIVAFDQPKPIMSDGRIMQTPNDRPLWT